MGEAIGQMDVVSAGSASLAQVSRIPDKVKVCSFEIFVDLVVGNGAYENAPYTSQSEYRKKIAALVEITAKSVYQSLIVDIEWLLKNERRTTKAK